MTKHKNAPIHLSRGGRDFLSAAGSLAFYKDNVNTHLLRVKMQSTGNLNKRRRGIS